MEKARVSIFLGGLGLAFAGVAISQLSVQILDAKGILNRAAASSRFLVQRRTVARRGDIFTSDGKPLAENVDASQMCVDFSMSPKTRAFCADLSAASGIPEAEIEAQENSTGYTCWAQPLPYEQVLAINKVKEDWKAGGVSVGPLPKRRYPFGPSAAGLVGKLLNGKAIEGLENLEEPALAGVDGRERGMVDRQGAFLPQWSTESAVEADGKSVVTTIDSYMQTEASDAIEQAVDLNNAVYGSAIVIDPQTGNILAMANWPSFDPDPEPDHMKFPRTSDLDSAYMARLEPGSMLKILTLAKGLDSGRVTTSFTFDCQGTLDIVGNAKVRCDVHHGTRAHGLVDVAHVIGESCNISAATWAMRIGHDPFIDFLRSAKLFSKPGLGLKGEVSGAYDENDPSPKLQVADMGFGQSVVMPPLSLACAFAGIANGGYRVAPRLVDKVGGVEQPKAAANRIMSTDTANKVLDCMSNVIQQPFGTGYAIRIPGYWLAGKTGTAQIANGNGGYVSNFVGFVPGHNATGSKPKVEILVMIDHPRNGQYFGAAVAAPVFRELALAAIRRYQIPPNDINPTTAYKLKA